VHRHRASERGRDLLGGGDSGPVLRLGGARPEVRRHHDIGEREERRIGRRLFLEDVERGPGDGPVLERVVQGHLVHDAATRYVYEVGGWFHLLQSTGIHHAGGLRCAGDVQRDEVGVLEDLVQRLSALHVYRAHPVLGDVRVVG
jgi:hypothetical protein